CEPAASTQEVHMGVVESRHHSPPTEVDDFGIRACQPADCRGGAYGQDALTFDCDGLGFRLLGIFRPDSAVQKNQRRGPGVCSAGAEYCREDGDTTKNCPHDFDPPGYGLSG